MSADDDQETKGSQPEARAARSFLRPPTDGDHPIRGVQWGEHVRRGGSSGGRRRTHFVSPPQHSGEPAILSRGGVTGPAARLYWDPVGRGPIASPWPARVDETPVSFWPVVLLWDRACVGRLVGVADQGTGHRCGEAAWRGRAPTDLLCVASARLAGTVRD
jgi:hypothetical protein